ncbi:MAG: hypothetical protein QXI12_06685 [Candidatus Methanomethyliaceae archaeon]
MADLEETIQEEERTNSGPSLEAEAVQPVEIAAAVEEALTTVKTEELRSIAEVMRALTETLDRVRKLEEEAEISKQQLEAAVERMETLAERVEVALIKPQPQKEEEAAQEKPRKLPRPRYL